jgi:hypothetical protein
MSSQSFDTWLFKMPVMPIACTRSHVDLARRNALDPGLLDDGDQRLRIPTKSPGNYEMIAPIDSWMMPPPRQRDDGAWVLGLAG